ncbi:phage portal protein [Rhizobium sp. BK602]|uniref:phage portal protein n=1 Tax=Rhizobium sp. BK602 TaxID=2586986 RepID=UPI0017ADDF5B|nr:phage portal protein [Rhizobium sp. BK602]MBB3608660.1 lambda family phage portal protein [Rhizobium sp. BK602]
MAQSQLIGSILGRMRSAFAPAQPVQPPKTQAYLRDTRSGVIATRQTVLREHRDEIRRVWDRTAALAMDMIQNSGRLKGACDQIIADTVGVELTLNPQPDLSALGYNDAERRDWIALVKRRWKQWAWNRAECDFRGKLTIPQMADIGLRYWIAFGESLPMIAHMSDADQRRYGIGTSTKMLMVPPTRLVRDTQEALGLYQGVFHDANGRADAYRFRWRRDGMTVTEDMPVRDALGQSLIEHIFDPMDATDVRGISLLAPTFRRYIQHEMLDDATLQTFILQTLYAVTLTSDAPSADAFEALEVLKEAAPDAGAAFVGDFADYLKARMDRAMESRISIGADPTVSHLAPGEELNFRSASVPGGEYMPFSTSLSRDTARAMGITLGGLTMDHSDATYSAVRMETSSIWPVVQRRRDRIAAPHYQLAYENLLDEDIYTGRIPFKGGYEAFAANRDRVCWALWQGPAKPTADDQKSAKASSERIVNGTTTLAHECAELGLDPEEVFEQRMLEHQRYVDAGMPSPFERGMPSDPVIADEGSKTGGASQ